MSWIISGGGIPKGNEGNYHPQCTEVSWKQSMALEMFDILTRVSYMSYANCAFSLLFHCYFLYFKTKVQILLTKLQRAAATTCKHNIFRCCFTCPEPGEL